jgi:hypothetical protein
LAENAIPLESFRAGLTTVLDEIFEHVHGYMLDPGTSLFETLADVTAEEASRPISKNCACLAAQVNHVRYYMDLINEAVRTGEYKQGDWPASWRVGPVTDAEWQDLLARLRATYQEIKTVAETKDNWEPQFVGGAFALVGHCAYHLGEIRQGLGVLRG